MAMYNEELAANSAMIRATNQSTQPPSLEQHPEIRHVRKILLVVIGIDLVLWVVNFLFIIHTYADSDSLESQYPNSSSQLALIIVSLIYYGFALLVTYRYYQTGLLVCVLLGLVSFVLTGAMSVVLFIRISRVINSAKIVTAGVIVAIIFVSVCIFILILQIIIIIYCIRMYRLLKANKYLTIEQI